MRVLVEVMVVGELESALKSKMVDVYGGGVSVWVTVAVECTVIVLSSVSVDRVATGLR